MTDPYETHVGITKDKGRLLSGYYMPITVSAYSPQSGVSVTVRNTAEGNYGQIITIDLPPSVVKLIRENAVTHFDDPKHKWGCFEVEQTSGAADTEAREFEALSFDEDFAY